MATIYDVRDALLDLPDKIATYHFAAPEQRPNQFIIWAETAVDFTLAADDEPRMAEPRGQIYYYTDIEYDRQVNDIVRALINRGIAVSITNIGWDYMLKQFVYEMTWQLEWGIGDGTCEVY